VEKICWFEGSLLGVIAIAIDIDIDYFRFYKPLLLLLLLLLLLVCARRCVSGSYLGWGLDGWRVTENAVALQLKSRRLCK